MFACFYLYVSIRSSDNDDPADAVDDDDDEEIVKHCDNLNISLSEFAMQLCISNIKQRVISYLTGEIKMNMFFYN